jgi:cytochrome c biogenesis protein CcmG/thiol:disulfide interchange protein DsbE
MNDDRMRIAFLSILLAAATLASACSSDSRKPAGALKPVPQFTLSSLDGKTVAMKDLSNKVVVSDFWATWCPPCREEIPHLNRLYSDYKGQGLEIIGISMDDGPDVVKEFAREFRMEYPLVMGNDELADQFGGVLGLPTTFIVDRKGNIVKKFVGLPSAEALNRIVRELVG